MALLNWSPTLSVGVQALDEEHRQLVGHLNELHDALCAGKGEDALRPILEALVACTVTHFGTEERLMGRHLAGDVASHEAEHRKLLQDISDFKRKFESDATAISIDIMNFLRDWLANHIMKSDKTLGQALNAAGIK